MPYYNSNETKRYIKSAVERIEKSIYQTEAELKITAWVTREPVSFENRFSGKKQTLAIGQKWGDLWDCAWFHFTGTVPESAAGKKVVLLIDISGEACVVDREGCPVQGLTNVNSEFDYSLGRPGKRVIHVSNEAQGGEEIDLWVDAGCNDLFGKYKDSGTVKEAHIAVCNEEMRKLYYDFEVLYELMEHLPKDRARYHSILFALEEAANVLKRYDEEEVEKARKILAVELNKKGADPSLRISAIGHAHIDLAWLWPIRETIRKGARTFSTALKMMETYLDYVFGASQPQLYRWVKEYYPPLYEKIKQRVREGRWEVQGAMWVEADTNVSGGEALVRQILFGKRFFQEEFNKDMKILWLPDVFGYSGALPQILKKSGVDYFSTIKLSWSRHNKYPHHTFFWQGIDGSSVLAHMPPEGTYNSSAAPRAVISSEREYLDKGVSDRCLLLFGIGDGGGGPGEEHLERLMREKNLDGLVPVTQEPALDFFKKLEHNAGKYKTWSGELYLETHQGTYTSQARNKRFNRKLEMALRELEYVSILAFLQCNTVYPKGELDEIWKEVLLYQFHDILPGSSIKRVYTECLEWYEFLMERVKKLTGEAYTALADKIHTENFKYPVLVTNSLSWERTEWICIDGKWMDVKVPAMGYAVVDMDSHMPLSCDLASSENLLENDLLKIEFADDGTIVSIYDKEFNREILACGTPANRLAVYEDLGDAWDFPIQYDQKISDSFMLEKAEATTDGPCAMVQHVYSFGQSRLNQKVVLTAGSRRIDFVTEVDWNESDKMLRTSFPVNIFTKEVTCDIQFGSVKRPTHRNTGWDMAKYEICAHKWVDLSQGDYGVALLNDCKYGHKVLGNTMDINLLRSSGHPDPEADRAHHKFVYSLYPHTGNHITGGVSRAGYELNVPLNIIPLKSQTGSMSSCASYIGVDAENVIIETVKKAEDSDDMIIRLYECHGAGVRAKLHFNLTVKSAQLVNMMEEWMEDLAQDKGDLELYFRPFEIHTLKLNIERKGCC